MKKRNIYVMLLVISLLMIVIAVVGLLILKSQENNNTEVKVFNSKNGSFEVGVPKEWEVSYDDFIEATTDFEGTPDGGMKINIDQESYIYITVSIPRIYHDVPLTGSLKTKDGLTLNTYPAKGKVEKVKISDYMAMDIKVSDSTYDKYEKDILNLIKSFKVIN